MIFTENILTPTRILIVNSGVLSLLFKMGCLELKQNSFVIVVVEMIS